MKFQQWLGTPHGKQVYNLFRKFALTWKKAGHDKCAGSLIVNRIRWEMAVTANWQGFKVTNNFAPMMARQLVLDDPAYDGFFNFHKDVEAAETEATPAQPLLWQKSLAEVTEFGDFCQSKL